MNDTDANSTAHRNAHRPPYSQAPTEMTQALEWIDAPLRSPLEGPNRYSPSQGVRDNLERNGGVPPRVGGWSPRVVPCSGIKNIIWGDRPLAHIDEIATRRRGTGAIPDTWAYDMDALETSEPSGTHGPTLEHGGMATARGSGTRNAAARGAGYIPVTVRDLAAHQKGGARSPPQKISPSEGGWVA